MRLDKKAKLVVLAGGISASVFVFLGVRELSGSGSPDISANAETVPLQMAQPQALLAATTRQIHIGETFTSDMFRSATSNPNEHPGVASTAEVLGKVASHDIAPNTLINRNALTPETRLAIRVPVGMRATSIETTDEIAVAGLIRPGDHVDVQVVYPGQDSLSGGGRQEGRSRASTLLQMVEVLAVGVAVVGEQPSNGALSSPPPPARTVTLALSPEQVSTLALAKNTGALSLALRNPKDQDFADGVWSEPGFAAAAPTAFVPPAPRRYRAPKRVAAAPAKPAERPIELVVGGRKSTIYSEGASK